MWRNWLGPVLWGAALVPLAFLTYTLTHLEELGIGVWHGRVVVEALLVIAFFVLGIVFWR